MSMTLKEAIEIVTHMTNHANVSSLEDCIDALKLLIEAGKVIEGSRQVGSVIISPLLPGETEE